MRPTSPIESRSARGFTLVELIVVIVLAGILGGLLALFGTPIRGAIEAQRRAELADAADTAYRRMARDLRRALPNSIRVNGSTLELIPTKDGGRYTDAADSSGHALSFTDATDKSFDMRGPTVSISANDFIVVNNWGSGSADAYCSSSTCNNRAQVSSVAGATVTLAANPFAVLGTEYAAPGSHFHVVSATEQAVSYDCSGGQLVRRWGYGFSHGSGGQQALLAQNIACEFDKIQYADGLWGLIYLSFTLSRADLPGETVKLVYQLHVDNTP